MKQNPYVDAAKVSTVARTRWNQMKLGGRAMALLAAVDIHLAGHGKLEDRITNDQLMAAAGLTWNTDLERLRAEVVAKGCISYTPGVGGRSGGGVGYGATYAYLPEDRLGTP